MSATTEIRARRTCTCKSGSGLCPTCSEVTHQVRQERRQRAIEAYAHLVPFILKLREKDCTYEYIANRLNANGETTREGRDFVAATVHRIVKRLGR